MIKKRTIEIIKILDKTYGTEKICYLNYKKDYELLIATILSARCTDIRVNKITEILFKKYKYLREYKRANLKDIEEIIKPAGLYKTKAQNIKKMCSILLEKYNGKVPSDINDLIKLPGVGRKTANVIRGNIFDIPCVVVDTHVSRISNRLGFTKSNNPTVIEKDLMKELPKDHWIIYNIQIITFGRTICLARSPKCSLCMLKKYCLVGK